MQRVNNTVKLRNNTNEWFEWNFFSLYCNKKYTVLALNTGGKIKFWLVNYVNALHIFERFYVPEVDWIITPVTKWILHQYEQNYLSSLKDKSQVFFLMKKLKNNQ